MRRVDQPMTCDRIRPLLSDYHDDALSSRRQSDVRAHVVACASCGAALEGYDRLYATLRRAPAPVPPDLRRDVYAAIAQRERARPPLPFAVPNAWGSLRAAGGTAGLLAVLGGLVYAAMHAPGAPALTPSIASAKEVTAARTMVSGVVSLLGAGHTTSLPPDAQTAVAPVRTALAGTVALTVGKGARTGSGVSLPLRGIRRAASGAPLAYLQGHAAVAMRSSTPVVSDMVVTHSPAPTIAPGDGLAYLRLQSPAPLLRPAEPGYGNAWADVRFHVFAPRTEPITLATHAENQLFTGLAALRDGHALAVAAMGQEQLGGVFQYDLDTGARRSSQLLPFPDVSPVNSEGRHRYVRQVYATSNGPLLFTVVDAATGGTTVTVAMTTSGALTRTVKTIEAGDAWFDYVVSPDHHYIAWTKHPGGPSSVGTLEVAPLDARPVTVTVGAGAHPVWSPDGARLLYESDNPPGLYIWSASRGARRVVPLDSIERPALGDVAWSPDGRFFAYVQSTLDPGRGTSTVSLAATDSGVTWPVFHDAWIGSIAWTRAPAPAATPPPTMTPGPPPAGASPAPRATPLVSVAALARTLFDNTDGPANVVHSFYNAINRREYARAYSYLSFLPGDAQDRQKFVDGYATTSAVTLTTLQQAPYTNDASFNATTCVAFGLTTQETTGAAKHYGGWYLVRSTTGEAPTYGGWRIVMDGAHSTQGGRATIPPQARCAIPSRGRSTRTTALPPSGANH